MLRHKETRSVKRAFSVRLGTSPEVVVNADQEGTLRAPPDNPADPIETGQQIEEAFPCVAERLLSIYPGLIEVVKPESVPAPRERKRAPEPEESASTKEDEAE